MSAGPMSQLFIAHDGPIPSPELAAARWGSGAWERLARGADAALIQAHLGECVAVLGTLRRAGAPSILENIARAVARYRRLSVSLLGSS